MTRTPSRARFCESQWRKQVEQALEGARKAFKYASSDAEAMEYQRRIDALENALGRQTLWKLEHR